MKKVLFLLLSCMLFSCQSNRVSKKEAKALEPSFKPGPHVIIYATRGDYANLVPVVMNTEKTEIIQYPAISDMSDYSNLTPVELKKGFWLDRKGVGVNTVFLSYTYEAYANLIEVPSLKTMLTKIVDKDPFKRMYDCGNPFSYKNKEAELNAMIKHQLVDAKCKKLK